MENVGSIEYDARINTRDLKRDADKAEGIVGRTGDAGEESANRSSRSWTSFGKVLGTAVVAAGIAVTAVLLKAGQASWEQVSAVEQATVGLKAYETNADKVGSVLKALISYARSDLGVLFNRKDLFDSAQQLKLMGDNTDDLVGHVKILSRSVGLGLSNWSDLNQIVGRVGSTGRLTGDDFDNLTKAGYRLSPALRNTDVTFKELFKSLDKGIPVKALDGQANTIEGIGIRFQTAFRGIGDAILGVDADTSKFKPGSLGEKIIEGIKEVSAFLKNSDVKETVSAIGATIVSAFTIASKAISSFISVFQPAIDYVRGNQKLWEVLKLSLMALGAILLSLAVTVGILLVGAFVIIAATIEVVIGVVEAIIRAVIAFGQGISNVISGVIRFGKTISSVFITAVSVIRSTFGSLGGFFQGVWNNIISMFRNVGTTIGNAIGNSFRSVINSVLRGAVNMINGFISAINGVVDVINHIPGVSIGRLGTLPVPQLASGGIVTSPTLAMIGEGRESEAVIPLSKLDDMLNGTSAKGSTINIELNLSGIMTRSKSDEREIARTLIKRLNEELHAKGVSPIGGGSL